MVSLIRNQVVTLARNTLVTLNRNQMVSLSEISTFIGLLVSAHQVTGGRSLFYTDAKGQQALPGGPQSFDNTENVKDNLHRFNTGIEGNVGINYRFGLNNIFIEGGGNYGFLNIQKSAINGKNGTGAAVITVGYSYYLGDKY